MNEGEAAKWAKEVKVRFCSMPCAKGKAVDVVLGSLLRILLAARIDSDQKLLGRPDS